MTEYKSFDLVETARAMLDPMRGRESLKAVTEQFWLNQGHLLDCIEDAQRSWITRRHEGTRAARAAVVAILTAETPSAAANEYQQWARGALNRMIDDTSAAQQLITAASISAFMPISSPLTAAASPVRKPPASDAAA